MIPTFLKPYHTNLSNLIRLGRKSDGGYVIDKRVINKTNVIGNNVLNIDKYKRTLSEKFFKNYY